MVNDLSSEELLTILESCGWFAPARAILCRRALENGGADAAQSAFNDSLLYFPDASYVALRLARRQDSDFADESRHLPQPKPRVILAGMDYFSREDYESVRDASFPNIGRIAAVDYSEPFPTSSRNEDTDGEFSQLVTETLAQIYVEQGYTQQAIDIYNKLSLQSPEKSSYFASLIDKLNN